MSDIDELKPCPFCGQYPDVLTGSSIVAVVCPRCGYEFDWPLSSDWRAEWNTRPIEDALQARITELEAALRKVAVAAEWAATLGGGFSYCPVCGNEKRDGHAPDCEISKALEAWRKARGEG